MLKELAQATGLAGSKGFPDVPVTQVTDDSRRVRPGALFVAVRGSRTDGHSFVPEAIRRGAGAVMVEWEVAVPEGIVRFQVPSTRDWLGPLVHAFLGFPSRRLQVIGVTGTKGKTTVAWLVQHLLQHSGIPCGLLGTVFHRWGDQVQVSTHTTPGVVELQESLSEMAERGMRACAMEVSSHALDQRRTEGIRWGCAVFTNLDSEHLDYHGTLEDYLKAKLRLFEALSPEGTAVLNRSDPSCSRVRRATRARALTYGLTGEADWTAQVEEMSLSGISFVVRTPQGSWGPVSTPLIGLHNLENLLAALAAVGCMGVPIERAVEGVPRFLGVPGRLERIEAGQSFPVFVDYAHTEGALRRVLEQLRRLSDRKILTVFGCGGDRDRAKRPRMGRAAMDLSDRVVVTSDNPRSEDPAQIAREIVSGMEGGGRAGWEVILDRREAIRTALESADERWLVLIAGKGHESLQVFADRSVAFDDREVVRELLGVERVSNGPIPS